MTLVRHITETDTQDDVHTFPVVESG